MQLSSAVSRAIDLNTHMGTTHRAKAIAAAITVIRGDPEATEEAYYVAVSKLVLDQTTKIMRRLNGKGSAPHQYSFFGDRLRERYALDLDERVIKDLARLSRLEFSRIIAIRKNQLDADAAHLEALREAEKELAPIWDEYPDKNYGDIEKIYLRRRRNGNGVAEGHAA